MGHAGPVDRLLTSCGLVLARRSPPLGIPFRPPLPWRQADVAAACAALGDLSTAEEVVARLHHMSGAARTSPPSLWCTQHFVDVFRPHNIV